MNSSLVSFENIEKSRTQSGGFDEEIFGEQLLRRLG